VPLQLTSGTLQSFQNEIPWQHLPLTFQHAIVMAKKLNIQYLWIDSLCILQDDFSDWLEEGSKMAAIYSGAILTMAATASSDSTRGLWLSQERSRSTGNSGYPEVHCFTSPDGSAYKIRKIRDRICYHRQAVLTTATACLVLPGVDPVAESCTFHRLGALLGMLRGPATGRWDRFYRFKRPGRWQKEYSCVFDPDFARILEVPRWGNLFNLHLACACTHLF